MKLPKIESILDEHVLPGNGWHFRALRVSVNEKEYAAFS